MVTGELGDRSVKTMQGLLGSPVTSLYPQSWLMLLGVDIAPQHQIRIEISGVWEKAPAEMENCKHGVKELLRPERMTLWTSRSAGGMG